MEGLLTVLVIVIAVISRPVEVRLWRAGRISDRTLAIAGLARFPIVVFAFGLIVGASWPLLLALTALSIVPGFLFYSFMRTVISDQRAALKR